MTASRFTYLWIQDGIPARRFLGGSVVPLAERLAPACLEESSGGEKLVLDAAHAVFGWALEHDASWSSAAAGEELEQGLAAWEQRHGWLGPVARFSDSLRLAWSACTGARPLAPRTALSEEAGLWIWSQRASLADLPEVSAEWSGEALAPGRRLPARDDLARHAAADLEPGETILVHGASEALLGALETAWKAGKQPRVLCAEGLPLLTGRRLARRLGAADVPVTLVYDAALLDAVAEADRIWIATESVGAGSLLAPAGARQLARAAEEQGVPLEVLATSDALLPGGELGLPAWMAADRSLLWPDAPGAVELRTVFLEELPLACLDGLRTERGRERIEDVFLRAMRLERPPRCVSTAPADADASTAPADAGATHDLLRPVPRANVPQPPVLADAQDDLRVPDGTTSPRAQRAANPL